MVSIGNEIVTRWPATCWVWEVICALSIWRWLISICGRGAISSGADWVTPKLKPSEFEVDVDDVEFSPPRVIKVPCDFQVTCIEPVAQYLMPYDKAEMNF